MNYLKADIRLTSDGDKWGNTMNWLFHIADEITFNRSFPVPAEWQFKPSPLGSGNQPEDYETELVQDCPDKDLLFFGRVLNRYADCLKKAGLDY